MASAKAPFGTMHNQPPPCHRKLADPAPWDKDPTPKGRAPLASRSSSSGSSGNRDLGRSIASRSKDSKDQLGNNSSNNSERKTINSAVNSSSEKQAVPPVSRRSAAAAAQVAGSTKTAPFGTAHNAPVQPHKDLAARKAPWERDDSQRFQKIAFGNLKSFGAFIRT